MMKRLAYLLLALPLIPACSSNDNSGDDTNTSSTDQDVTARAVGQSASQQGGDASAMASVTAIAQGQTPLGFTLSGDGSFQGSTLGIDYDFSLTCKDASGNTQVACDATTDSADASVDWSGSLSVGTLSTSIDRSGDWSISGLQGDTATFDGSGSLAFDMSASNAAYHFNDSADYNGVLVDTSSHTSVGGSITYTIDATKTVDGNDSSFSMTADVDFSADGSAMITIDGSTQYTLDVATGAVVKVND
ncbi:MAG TPA: hypothetical protein VGM88_33305 [Kofleriaceae bacterium]|jgi:hypothetical protein